MYKFDASLKNNINEMCTLGLDFAGWKPEAPLIGGH